MNPSVSCEMCGQQLLSKNLKRHCDRYHSSRDSEEQVTCAKEVMPVHNDITNTVVFEPTEWRVHSETVDEAVASILDKKLSYRRETARQLHTTTWAGQLTF